MLRRVMADHDERVILRAVKPRTVEIPAQIRDAMTAHSRFMFPFEACGLLAGPPQGPPAMVYCLTNRFHSRTRYLVDPAEHFGALRHAERHGWDIIGVFHSHPGTVAEPSPADIAGALDPEWLYIIVGLQHRGAEVVRGFRIAGGAVTEESLLVVPDRR